MLTFFKIMSCNFQSKGQIMTLGGVYKFKVDYSILTKGIYGPLSAPTYNRFKNLNCQVIDIFRK